jgi:hypothetical protein
MGPRGGFGGGHDTTGCSAVLPSRDVCPLPLLDREPAGVDG